MNLRLEKLRIEREKVKGCTTLSFDLKEKCDEYFAREIECAEMTAGKEEK